jgi:signal transduction protein with GAF and PtsI domain
MGQEAVMTAMNSRDVYFRALYEVAETVTSTLSLSEVLQNTARSTAKAMNAKACSVRLWDRPKGTLDLGASYGLSREYLEKGPVEVEKSGIDKEALQGHTVAIRNVMQSGRFQYPEEAANEGIVSVLAAPLMVRGTVIGVIRVYSEKERNYNFDETHFLTAIAHISALAIHNAKTYEDLQEELKEVRHDKIPWAENFDKPLWRD